MLSRAPCLVVGFLVGCGAAPAQKPAVLDCAWALGDNCWKQAATRAMSCLPPDTETGILDATQGTCTYASGAVVTFGWSLKHAAGIPLDLPNLWSFSMEKGGQPCVRFEEVLGKDHKDMILTIGDHTVVRANNPAEPEVSVTCPDGTAHATSTPSALQACWTDPDTQFGGLPGYSSMIGMTTIGFGLVNVSSTNGDTLWVFKCQE